MIAREGLREGLEASEEPRPPGEWALQRIGAKGEAMGDELLVDAGTTFGHARLLPRDGGLEVADLAGGTGVWIRVQGAEGHWLAPDDQLWLGSQVLVIERDEAGWALRHHGPDGRFRAQHALTPPGVFVGRSSGLVLDETDTRLSRRHAQLAIDDGSLRVFDRGAHNGTYWKLREPVRLQHGDELRIDSHHLRVVKRESPVVEPAPVSVRGGLAARLRALPPSLDEQQTLLAEPLASQPTPQEIAGESCLVVIESDRAAISLEAAVGQTLLDAIQQAGLPRGEPIDWECGDGGCGVCIVGVLEGADRLDPPDPALDEMKTIQITEQVVPDPRRYRLACLARVRGPVRLRKL